MRPLLPLLLAASLAAQKIPDPVDNAREIQVHDIRAVLDAIGLKHDVELPGEEAEGAQALHRRDRLADLTELVRVFVEPPLADPGDLQPLGTDLLVLRGDPQQQASLHRLLLGLSRLEGRTVAVECQLISVEQAVFQEAVAPLLGLKKDLKGGGGTVARLVLAQEDAGKLTAALKKLAGVEVVQSPRLLLLPAQKGNLRIMKTTHYRQDWEVEVVDGKVKPWPITGKLEDGFVLDVRAAPLDDEVLGMQLSAVLSTVIRPIPTFETTLAGSDDKVVVDLPQVTVRRLQATPRLGEGSQAVLVGGTAEDADRILLLVRAW